MRKKNLFHHVIAVVILLIGFVLCRYVFFDVHEMKEFPLLLFALGLAALIISCLSSKKVAPYFISLGYIIGFAFGFIFQITKMNANGVSVNNLWVIWGAVYVICIILGFLFECVFLKHSSSTRLANSKVKKIWVSLFGIFIVWVCIGMADFSLVHNYKKPFFCIGVDLADDGGSGMYMGLGYAFDIEGNFMPESVDEGVTSYRGYLFGKEVCRGFWEKILP